MKLAASNIAWTADADSAAAARLRAAGVEALEAAPSRLFSDIPGTSNDRAKAVAAHWRVQGLPILSMQSLLYGCPDLRLFGSAADQRALVAHLEKVIGLAGAMGCRALVFGSPGNRQKGARSFAQAAQEAAPVFRDIGDICAAAGPTFCLEANAAAYGCDFMTCLQEAGDVVALVNHAHVRLVLDTGNMALSGDGPDDAVAVAPMIAHMHASAPQLAPLAGFDGFVRSVLAALPPSTGDLILTLEMRAAGEGLAALEAAAGNAALLSGLLEDAA